MKRHFESDDLHVAKRPCDDTSQRIVLNGIIGSGNYGQVVSITMPSGLTHALKLTKKQNDANDVHSVVDLARDVFGLSKSQMLLGLSYDKDCHDRIGIHMPLLGHRFGNISVPHLPAEQVAALTGPIIHDMIAFDGLHRDIKLANMCFGTQELRARLVDFSLATNMKQSTDENVVTIWYRAPEIILGLEYTEKADVWSMGLVLLNLLSGTHVLRSASEETRDYLVLDIFDHFGWPQNWPELSSIYKSKFGGHIHPRPGEPAFLNLPQMIQTSCAHDPNVTKLAYDLLSMMLKTDHRERASWATVAKHPFWSLAREAPIMDTKLLKMKPAGITDISEFLSRSKTKNCLLVDTVGLTKVKSKIILMDHVYHYARNIFKFSDVTVVKAFYIYLNAIAGGSSFGIPLLISSILLAASFNEEIRPNRSFTWEYLASNFDEDPTTMCPLLKTTTIEALYNCSGHWPSQMPNSKFEGPMAAFAAICDDQDLILQEIKNMEPGKLVCI